MRVCVLWRRVAVCGVRCVCVEVVVRSKTRVVCGVECAVRRRKRVRAKRVGMCVYVRYKRCSNNVINKI